MARSTWRGFHARLPRALRLRTAGSVSARGTRGIGETRNLALDSTDPHRYVFHSLSGPSASPGRHRDVLSRRPRPGQPGAGTMMLADVTRSSPARQSWRHLGVRDADRRREQSGALNRGDSPSVRLRFYSACMPRLRRMPEKNQRVQIFEGHRSPSNRIER